MGKERYWLQTLGCPKNQVDSDKLAGLLAARGYQPAAGPEAADLVVVNTCAFIEAARQESIDTVLDLAEARRPDARLVVTGCLAERYGPELAAALPEVDLVAGFGAELAPPERDGRPVEPASPGGVTPAGSPTGPVPVSLGTAPHRRERTDGTSRSAGAADHAQAVATTTPAAATVPSFDLLELDRPPTGAPWAYVKVAEGCDRICGFCAIPSFRGRQRSRSPEDVLREVAVLAVGPGSTPAHRRGSPTAGVREVVLVAQDLASYGRDRRTGQRARAGGTAPIVALTRAVAAMVPRTRLLYLYPSGLTDELVSAVLDTRVPYFDLSLQHVARPLLARMRRWGDGERFLRRIAEIRQVEPGATFRSSFILGYPGETEEDHDALLDFLRRAQLDWAGFFPFSPEEGTHAVGLPDQVPPGLALERLRECAELQDGITARRRDAMVGQEHQVLVDAPGMARTVHEAPEIDGVVRVPEGLAVGALVDVVVTASLGTDLVAEPVRVPVPAGAGAAR